MKKTIVMRLVQSYVESDTAFAIILNNGTQEQPLRFLEEDSECLIVENITSGSLSAFNYNDINNIMPVSSGSPIDSAKAKDGFISEGSAEKNTASDTEYWIKEYEKAVKIIKYDTLPLINRRGDIKARVRHTEIEKTWGRIDSMFNDAKKNHSLKLKADRIIHELDALPDFAEVKISLGSVFAELGEYDTAAEEFYYGGDYYNAACCAEKNGDDKAALYYLKCLIKSGNSYDSGILPSLFSLICKYKDTAFCIDTFDKPDPSCAEIVYYGLLMLYKEYDVSFDKLGKSNGQTTADISLIIGKLSQMPANGEADVIKLTSFASAEVLKGKIISFFILDNNAFGYITVRNESPIHFNIRQVEDDHLRSLLWNGYINKSEVSLTSGVGTNGIKAADHIKSCVDLSSVNLICCGMLTSYNYSYNYYDECGSSYGIINCEGHNYLFRDNAIIDPVLKAYIKNAFTIKNIYVKFVGKKIKGDRVAIKVWLDDVEEKELFGEYYPYAAKEDYDLFIKEINELEQGTPEPCPFGYESIPVWRGETITEPAKASEPRKNGTSTSAVKSKQEHLSINELLANVIQYLTREKDLEKAEQSFLAVLERKPERSHINTAVSNLVTIYKQENRTDEALVLLKNYRDYIERDKYNHHLIDIYNKAKRYDDLIEVLKEVIPSDRKSKRLLIKQLITCYLKTNNAQEAINVLKKHKRTLDNLTYDKLYFSALDLLGDFSQSELFLKNLITGAYKVEHKLNYMNRLAALYIKAGKANEAISVYEQWKKYYASNRTHITTSTAFAAIADLETAVDRNLCILYYNTNRVDEAKAIAGDLLRKNSEDSIAQQILDDTFISPDNNTPSISDEVEDYAEFESSDDSIPKLLEWMMNNVDYDKCFYNRNILNNIENTRYIGNESRAKLDIEDTLAHLKNRNYADRSIVYLALAKIIKQIAESGSNDKYFTQNRVNLFWGKGLLLKADDDIKSSYQNRNCSRYYYFLSLRYLSRSDDTSSFYHAINMLNLSFFLSDNELASAVDNNEYDKKLCLTPPDFLDSVISVKELMTYTFDLDTKDYHKSKIGGMKIIRKIINEVFENDRLSKSFTDNMRCLVPEISLSFENADEYFTAWKRAKEKYFRIQSNLRDYIAQAAGIIDEPEKLKCLINKIVGLNAEQILSKTDEEYLHSFLEILNLFHKLGELVIIDDLVDVYDKTLDSCETLEKGIRTAPTNISYENMLDVITILKGKAIKRKNDLYSESKPSLSVYPEDNAFYKGDHNQAKITIYVENKGNLQKADISNIVLSGKDNGIEIIGNPEHTITTVRGNGKNEYIVDISFTEEEKSRKLFDINFSFDYSYYDGSGEQVKAHFSDVFQINLSSIDSFVKIENKYSRFAKSAAVTSDDMFYGREKEINSIVESLDQGNGNVLSHRGIYMYGQKRAGKSSIMAHLAARINERYPGKYIIINLGSIGTAINAKYEIWLKIKILNKLADELEDNYPEIYTEIGKSASFDDITRRIEDHPDTIDFEIMLSKIERLLPDKVIMLFIDEFTYIYESIKKKQCSDTFPHFWKALLQNHNICSVIIGQDSMVNFVEEYANDFACMQKMFVSYLEEEGAKNLITDPIKDNEQNRFEDEALDLMYQLTAGSAYLIMIVCDQLVEYMNERGTSRVTKTTIETFIRKWLLNTSNSTIDDDIFDPQLNDPCFFDNSDMIFSDNKIILTYIANKCNLNNQIKIKDINCIDQLSQNTAEYQEFLINHLVKRKVLIKEGEYCRIWVDLLRRYLKS